MDIFNLGTILSLSKEPKQKEEFDLWVQQGEVIPFLEREIEDENR